MARRRAAGVAAGHRSRPRARDRAGRADARRDDRGAARQPHRARPRGHRPPARRRPLGHLHLAPHDRDRGRLRPRDRAARGRDGRRRRRNRGLRGAHRRADARRDRRASCRRRPPIDRRRRGAADADAPPRRRGLAAGDKLHDVSFELHPGEVLGVVALEGQGQDELFDILAGSERPSGGELLVDGNAVSFRHPADAIRAGRRLRRRRSRRGAPHAALGAREHRAPFMARLRHWGLDQPRQGAAHGRQRPSSSCRSTPAPAARCGGCRAATSRR